jgi:membrane protein implicated in regulation of membrane protease activity
MTVIGVLLILLAAVLLLIGLLAGSDTSTTLSLGGVDISMSAMAIFLMGAATVLIFVSGLELLRSGLRRSLRRRRELKEARAVVAEQERRDRDEVGAEPTTSEGAETPSGTTTTSTEPGTTGTATRSETSDTSGAASPAGTTTDGTTTESDEDPGRHAR